jgi:hypothetical protein
MRTGGAAAVDGLLPRSTAQHTASLNMESCSCIRSVTKMDAWAQSLRRGTHWLSRLDTASKMTMSRSEEVRARPAAWEPKSTTLPSGKTLFTALATCNPQLPYATKIYAPQLVLLVQWLAQLNPVQVQPETARQDLEVRRGCFVTQALAKGGQPCLHAI